MYISVYHNEKTKATTRVAFMTLPGLRQHHDNVLSVPNPDLHWRLWDGSGWFDSSDGAWNFITNPEGIGLIKID